MNHLEWFFFISFPIWLLAMFILEYRYSRPPGLFWFLIPLLTMLIYRSFTGSWQLSLITFTALLLSERRHLQSRILSAMLLVGAAILLFLLLPWAAPAVEEGIVGIFLFWIAWERKIISSQIALTLFVCVLFWMGIGFIFVYIVLGFIFLLAIRLSTQSDNPFSRLWNSMYAPILISFLIIMIDRVFIHILD
ncbi:MAG: hypothetical protein ABSC61_09890 [Anaerolineales bacterium]